VGGATYIFTHGSWQSILEGFPIAFGPVTIRRGVWLPWRVFILPNVEIGEYATLGAGALVSRSIAARTLAVGMPAKSVSGPGGHLKTLDEGARSEILQGIFREYRELLEYDGNTVKNSQIEGEVAGFQVSDKRGRTTRMRAFSRTPPNLVTRPGESLASLNRIPDDLCEQANRVGASWFDLERALASEGNDPFFHETRAFFSRFGIRFGIDNEPTFLDG